MVTLKQKKKKKDEVGNAKTPPSGTQGADNSVEGVSKPPHRDVVLLGVADRKNCKQAHSYFPKNKKEEVAI